MKKTVKKKLKVLKANQILLEDLKGRPRIFLDATDGKAGYSITLLGKVNGAIQISINDDNHGVISIHQPDGKTGACLAVMPEGQSGVELYDHNGTPSIRLSSKSKNQEQPAVIIQTKKGKKQLI